ncbi:MAG: PrgI family protein [Firmicutes bacterium]|nr:PrgI family protein [Bacillota bacterium]
MSIEVRVPEEIKDYKESIVAGLSIRQLLCGGVALLMGVPTFLLLRNIDQDLATYATMAVVVPAFCIGFIKKDGYNFETFLKIKLQSFFGKNKRTYETNTTSHILPIEIEEYAEVYEEMNKEKQEMEKERGGKCVRNKKKRKSERTTKQSEYDLIEVTAKTVKRKRKTAYKNIKAAARANRAKKQEEKEKT